ncbi:hypothetical protein [Caenimonas sp. SL110]|uniref:hypothetical protein n=1 Tax=Caenimonas sp. SL110 TaxID=1450524 RepID=UPI00065458C8|nr:hypothetical protein [Caenimonas sp. SL110]
MDWVSHAVNAFGHSVGLENLSLDDDGCALFELEPGGKLWLHDLDAAGGDEVLVVLASPLPAPAGTSARQALRLADFRVNPSWQTQLSVRGPDLVVTLRMPRHSFMLSALEEAVESLFSFHERVAQGS